MGPRDLRSANSYNSYTSNDSLGSIRGNALGQALHQVQAGLLPDQVRCPCFVQTHTSSSMCQAIVDCQGIFMQPTSWLLWGVNLLKALRRSVHAVTARPAVKHGSLMPISHLPWLESPWLRC